MSRVSATFRIIATAATVAGLAPSALRAELSPEALKQAQANFKMANVSSTGQLTPAEFKTFIDLNAAAQIGRAPKIKANNAYDRAFGKVDANKDGKVSWDEYLKAQSSP
jgi:Ca2+-binding EF-hand superfamily protein